MKYFVGVKKNNKSDIFKTNKKSKPHREQVYGHQG